MLPNHHLVHRTVLVNRIMQGVLLFMIRNVHVVIIIMMLVFNWNHSLNGQVVHHWLLLNFDFDV